MSESYMKKLFSLHWQGGQHDRDKVTPCFFCEFTIMAKKTYHLQNGLFKILFNFPFHGFDKYINTFKF